MNFIDKISKKYENPNAAKIPDFRAGDMVVVHAKIVEGGKTRIQLFQGTVIGIKAKGTINGHFRVRKISVGYGVERVFPFHSPSIEKVEVIQKGKVRRAKLYYLRDRDGKSARVSIDYDRK